MAERKPIGKKLRFEVFKRDSFRCQYCGRSAPDVILEVDHIKPVAEGGKNTLLNLITSCRDCNRGKGKVLIGDNQAVVKQKAALDDLNEKRQQMEMMIQWKVELEEAFDKQISMIERNILDNPDDYCFNDTMKRRVKMLINQFGFPLVYDASVIAGGTYNNEYNRKQKLGGICYNLKKRRENGGNQTDS